MFIHTLTARMDVYTQKIPTHYSRTALPPGVHAHKPTVLSVRALARDGNLSRECNYAIGKCLNWIIREMLLSLSK